jgi:uncharacterized membrane protein YbhN (UPF0104 family)
VTRPTSRAARTETERAAAESGSYLLAFATAAGLAMVAAAFAAEAAGLEALSGVTARFDPAWIAVCVGGQIVGYLGYMLALRSVAAANGGPDLSLGFSARTVVAGFGVYGAAHASGGYAVDYWALRRAGLERDQAIARVACLGTLEWAVLAPAALLSAMALVATGAQVQGTMTWPWLLVLPGACAAAWVTSPGRRERLADASVGGRIRAAFAHTVSGLVLLREMASRPRRHLFALLGIALYLAGDIACLWAALKAFSVDISVPALVLAYATGSVVSRRSLPGGGAGLVEVLMTFALVWVGIPLAPALAGVLLHRLFSFWLPMLPALPLLADVKRLRE